MRKLFLFLLLGTITQSVFGQKQNLGFNLKIGQTYNHVMHSSSSIKQEINGQEINIDVTLSGKMAFKVTNLVNTVYSMNVSYEQLAMTMKLPNGEMIFNSEKEDKTDIFSSMLGEIKGKQFLVKMTSIGKIVEVENLDFIFENLIDKFPTLTLIQKQQIKTQLKQAYGEKAFKGSFEMITAIYPNTAVSKGGSWEIKTLLETGFAATLTTTFELKDKTESYNLIVGKGKIITLDKDAYTQVNGMPTQYNLSGTMNSNLKVDPNTGWIIEAKVNQLIAGNVEIKDNPNLPGGMITPMSFEHVMNYSSK